MDDIRKHKAVSRDEAGIRYAISPERATNTAFPNMLKNFHNRRCLACKVASEKSSFSSNTRPTCHAHVPISITLYPENQ